MASTVVVDLTELVAHWRRFTVALDREARQMMEKIPELAQAAVKKQMKQGSPQSPASATFASGDQLTIRSGNLIRATIPGNEGNIYKLDRGGEATYRTEVGIDTRVLPYAGILEHGGFVRHKGKMPYFFFHLARETGNEFWAILGASALKRGGVNIRGYHYWEEAMKLMETFFWPKLGEQLQAAIPRIWEATR